MKSKIKYFVWIIGGVFIGLLTGYLRGFRSDSFWALSDIAGRYGFWIFTVSLIGAFAPNKKEAFINSFLYMFFMCVSYYMFLYCNKGIFYGKQLILWGIFAVLAAVYAFFLRKMRKKQNQYSVLICSIPIILLGIEGMNMLLLLIKYHTNFFQFVVDGIGTAVLTVLFVKKKEKSFTKKLVLFSFGTILSVCLCFLVLWSI